MRYVNPISAYFADSACDPEEGIMRRRDFLTKGAVAAGLASSSRLLPSLKAGENSLQKPSQISGLSADYLRRVQRDEFLPKPPAFAESSRPVAVQITPMPLAERIKRNIVPRRGFCSVTSGATLSEGFISGNGAMNIEMMCDPYSEQILFHHESLMMPYKRPYEAPGQATKLTRTARRNLLEPR
jgi:hypothetical protein